MIKKYPAINVKMKLYFFKLLNFLKLQYVIFANDHKIKSSFNISVDFYVIGAKIYVKVATF